MRSFRVQCNDRTETTVGLGLHELRESGEDHFEIGPRGDQIENAILVGEYRRLITAICLSLEALQREGRLHRQLLHELNDVRLEKLGLLGKDAQHSDNLGLTAQRERRRRTKFASRDLDVVHNLCSPLAQRTMHRLKLT